MSSQSFNSALFVARLQVRWISSRANTCSANRGFIAVALALVAISSFGQVLPNGKGGGTMQKPPSSRGGSPSKGTQADYPNGISYHGGPIINNTTHIYYIWYGNWDGDTAISILTHFGSAIGGSPYFQINTTYFDSTSQRVINAVQFAGSAFDRYSRGRALNDSDVQAIVANQISARQLPVDSNGVYFVLASADVTELSGFCTWYCAWHNFGVISGTNIKYAFIGNPSQCPAACVPAQNRTISPNGNIGADAMASLIAHELEESVTDPNLNAWYADDFLGSENADLCSWTFGSLYSTRNGAAANMRLGYKDYLVQQNWVNDHGGYCSLYIATANHFQSRVSTGYAFSYNGDWALTRPTAVVGVADVNGDGRADLILQYDDDLVRHWQVYLSNGSSYEYSGDWSTTSTAGVTVVGMADVNGDGKADLILQYDDSGGRHWQARTSNGYSFVYSGDWTSTTSPNVTVVGVTDVNGDKKADLILQYDDSGTRYWQARTSNGYSFVYSGDWSTTGTAGVTVVGMADVNGDGKADLILQYDDSGTRHWQARTSNGYSFVYSGDWTSTTSPNVTVVGVADVNGDRKADLVLRYDEF